MHELEFSVVIPCYNGERTIERQLTALAGQSTSRRFEVCVADNRSTDASAAIIKRFAGNDARFRYVPAFGNQGINHARNQAVLASAGRVILMCDADDIVAPGWIEAYASAFDAGAELAGGPMRHVTDGEATRTQDVFIPSPWRYQWPYGANCAFLRVAYDMVEGFDETFRGGGDETDFFWRAQLAGLRLTFAPGAWVDYYSRGSLRAVMKQKYSYGKSQVQLFKKFGAQGMPRLPRFRAAAAAVSALLGMAAHPAERRKYAARLGRNAGLIAGSIQQRTWYF